MDAIAEVLKPLTINQILSVISNKPPGITLTISIISWCSYISSMEPDTRKKYPIIPQADITLGISFDWYNAATNNNPPIDHKAIPMW